MSTIRKANIKDLNQLVKLRAVQQSDDWKLDFTESPDFHSRTKAFLESFLKNEENGVIFVAVNNKKIIATCGLQIMNLMPQCNDDGKYAYIFDAFTLKQFRNQGIQTVLLNKIIDFAKEHNISEISLETDNTIAMHMYKRCGFIKNDLFMTNYMQY